MFAYFQYLLMCEVIHKGEAGTVKIFCLPLQLLSYTCDKYITLQIVISSSLLILATFSLKEQWDLAT